ncbi:LEA type 2 family protein [Saccharophagus sp. K07]|uniref:LEA type 2 family protein n=1 Tax=Saccharophagus sp. K07 TaxID=2283636 RepID=UPI001651BFE2|nr:LEA type 2 family protein [Saccharophagus sp. K07]
MKLALSVLLAFVCAMVGGCAHLNGNIESPKVRVDSLRLLEPQGLNQRFLVGLRVINPNDRALSVKGLSYALALNGFNLLEGVSGKIPTLEPFSETLVEIEASTDLVGALRLLNNLTQPNAAENISYALTAKLSLQGWPTRLTVQETGLVPLKGYVNR